MGSVRTTPLPWLTVSLLVLGLAGGLLAFLAYPAYAQDGDAPLTARFLADTGPSNHGGDGQEFTIRIEFSEDINTSYQVLRDHALEVEGGTATKFKRVDGSNSLWEITVEPGSDADVTLTLPGDHRLRRHRGRLRLGRQEALQLADLHLLWPAPIDHGDSAPAGGV